MNALPDLGDLLRDAVDGIEPADRIDAIRARTANAPSHAARPWFYAAGGVVLATAATVAAFAVIGDSSPGHDHGTTAGPGEHTYLVAAYFVGDTPRGPRLFREFDEAPGTDPLDAALARIQEPAADPDYRTSWPHGSLDGASVVDGTIEVELGAAADVPSLALQQLAYTLQAAVGDRLPVHLSDGTTVTARPEPAVLSHIIVSDPTEGLEVHDHFIARGAANSFEANVPWEIRNERGAVVKSGFATADGWGDRLYPWQAHVDVRGLPFGYYTFVAMTDDPSGGEGGGPDADTRTIVVR